MTQTVKIGKTVYDVIGAQPYSRPGNVWKIQKGKEIKTLIYDEQNGTFTLWSGRLGLPKLVRVSFERSNPMKTKTKPNPVRIHRLKSGRFRVRSGKRLTAAATTHLRAIRQASLIRGVKRGWKPTGKPARSVRRKVAALKGSHTMAFRKKGRWTIIRGSMKAGRFRVVKKGLTEGQVRQWAKTNKHRIRAL